MGFLDSVKNMIRGNSVQRGKAFSYRAARVNRNKSFVYKGTSGDSHILSGDLDRLREACRQLDRDNCVASSILDRFCENIVGSGVNLKFKNQSQQWSEKAERLWEDWWNYEADVRGIFTGPEMERLLLRSKCVDGDIFIYKLDNGQIQLIEAHRIKSPKQLPSEKGQIITNGVLQNSKGRALSYFVADTSQIGNPTSGVWVPAEKVIFYGNIKRPSLSRGIPSFAVNLQMFEDLDAFIEATVISAKINAATCMAITRQDGGAGIQAVETETDADGNERQIQEWNPGMVEYLLPGEDIKVLSSTQQLVQFSPFVTQILRFAGLPFGLPLEATSLDFSKTNYSSARSALLLAHKSFMVHHQSLVTVLRSIAIWKIGQWESEGLLTPHKGTVRVSATPPTAIQIDPLKETNANIAKQQHGFSSNKDIMAAQGIDYLQVMEQRRKEIIEASKLAKDINKKYPETNAVWQDILGDAKNFLGDKYAEEVVEVPAQTNGDQNNE